MGIQDGCPWPCDRTHFIQSPGHQKLQGYRWLLGLAASFHLTPVVGKLYWHYATHHTPSIFPDFLAFCLSVGARVTWLFLFRDPAEFLHFKRPGRAYRLAVCG